MSAAQVIETPEVASPDAVLLRLQETLTWLGSLVADTACPTDTADRSAM